jgi:hypothetical protein
MHFFFRHLIWKTVGQQMVKGIHIENLFHLLIFSVDFFFEDVYNMRQVKTVGNSDSILFYYSKEVRS